jgi:hypothetical protein
MSSLRKQLIRANFEAYRDLTWAEDLEPRFRERGVDAASMEGFRRAWNEHTEARDWEWWQNDAKRLSNKQLDDDRRECLEKVGALGMLARQREQAESRPLTLQEILDSAAAKQNLAPERIQSHDTDRER